MHGFVLAAFATVLLAAEAGAPFVAGLESEAFASLIAACVSAASALAVWTRVNIRGLDRTGRVRHIYRVESAMALVRWSLLALHIAAVLVFDAAGAVRAVVGDGIVYDELLTVLPVLLVLVMTEWIGYPVERRLRDAMLIRNLDLGRPVHPYPPRARAVWLWTRHNVLFMLVPIVLLAAWMEATSRFMPELSRGTWGGLVVQIIGVAVVFAFIPPLLVRVWETTRLGPGPLHESLARLIAISRVGVRAVLVWRTGGAMLNGAAIGLLRPLRYVVLTDGLLENLSPAEVEAVMAHELAHIRLRHMVWIALAVVGAVTLAGVPLGLLAVQFEPGTSAERIAAAIGLGLTLLVAIGLMGWVSRRCEREADAWATVLVSVAASSGTAGDLRTTPVTPEAAHAMAGALSRVAAAHGLPIARRTLRHGSIAARQRFLLASPGLKWPELPARTAAVRARWVVIGFTLGGIVLVMASEVFSLY